MRTLILGWPQITAPGQTTLEEARRKAERTNSDMFASSYSGKWGDYSTDDVPSDTPKRDE